MSVGCAGALQASVYARLAGDAALTALVGDAVFDGVPPGPVPPLYVSLGDGAVRDRSDVTGAGADHRFTVSIVTADAGFAEAKATAAAVGDALVGADLALSRGTLVYLRFERATARRVARGRIRRIDLTFVARTADD